MTVHISVRLPWHDRGWDGHICDWPEENVYCGGLHSVNADRIREYKDVHREATCRGCHVAEVDSYIPPCSETINVFGHRPVPHVYVPPSFMVGTRPQKTQLPPFASGTWPYANMWDEDEKPRPPQERRAEAERFFSAIQPGKSVIFYYCNYDTPLTPDEPRYLLVGIARLRAVHDFTFWEEIPQQIAHRYGDFIWSVILENGFPDEGVRFPYQEYLRAGYTPAEVRERAVFVPPDLARRFKYVARHLSDDDATVLLEQAIVAFRRYQQEGVVTGPGWDWERQLEWLDRVLRECWSNRGPYPGLASVLEFCQFPAPATYILQKGKEMPAHQLRDYIFDRLAGNVVPDPGEEQLYTPAQARWRTLDPIVQRLCRECLPRFGLTAEQVQRILSAERHRWGITSSLETILENPYCLYEEYRGKDDDDRIGFHRIDNGMVPDPIVGAVEQRIPLDDPRRLRALMIYFLEAASRNGHTFLDRCDLYACLQEHHSRSPRVGRFVVDSATWRQHQTFFTEKLVMDQVEGVEAVFLRWLYDAESRVRSDVLKLVRDAPLPASGLDWADIIQHAFLTQQGWMDPHNNWSIRKEGGRKVGPRTVIIDEASMVPVDLMAAVFRALNWHQVERLVLVGDPNQLPPIGPGKPFLDIVDFLERDEQRAAQHLVRLTYNCRQEQGSWLVRLAEHFSWSPEIPDEEALWLVEAGGEAGDLVVRFWQDEKQLEECQASLPPWDLNEATRHCRNGLTPSTGSGISAAYLTWKPLKSLPRIVMVGRVRSI